MSEKLSVADILDRAADLIEPEGAWTQGALARTAKGSMIGPKEQNAACFCAMGAVVAAGDRADEAMRAAALALFDRATGGIVSFNDDPTRKQSEVVAKLREAAAISRALPGGEGK